MSGYRMPGRLSDRHRVKVRMRRAGLHTVCEEAKCPNIAECFGEDTATFLILGDVCTRACSFCAVAKNKTPLPVDADEARRLAEAVGQLGLSHAVITSVTRDDLADGGAGHFVACVEQIRKICPGVSVEILVPDFGGNAEAGAAVFAVRPDVFNHNVETIERLYPRVRPKAKLSRSLSLLAGAAAQGNMLVKSGIMVGIGEEDQEVITLLGQLGEAGCQMLTIGQYLRPSQQHLAVSREVTEQSFEIFRKHGREIGLDVLAGPLVRSSYRARESLARFVDSHQD